MHVLVHQKLGNTTAMEIVGFHCDITGTSHQYLGGYAARKQRSAGIFSTLEANGILIFKPETGANICIISIDLLFVSSSLKKYVFSKLRNRIRILFSDLILIASHTHFAPMIDEKKPMLGYHCPKETMRVGDIISFSILKAASKSKCILETAQYGNSLCNSSIYRRVDNCLTLNKKRPYVTHNTALLPNTKAKINQNVQLLIQRDNEGEPISAIWSWPCHCVSSPESDKVSADFPGAARQHLRTLFGKDIPVLYLPGFCGDIRPRYLQSKPTRLSFLKHPMHLGPRFAKNSIPLFNELCTNLLGSLTHARNSLKSITSSIDQLNSQTVDINLAGLIDRYNGPTNSLNISSVRFSGAEFLFLSAEVSYHYYDILNIDTSTPVFGSGYLNDCFGYLPSGAQVPFGGYEVCDFMPLFNVEGQFKTDITDIVAQHVHNVRQRV